MRPPETALGDETASGHGLTEGHAITRRDVWLLVATYIALIAVVLTAAAMLGRLF